jgi:putative aldouronate transport system permease protein
MTTLPESLIESAKIDGADEWRILFKIILPLSKPILATVLLFYAVDRWNEWFNSMVFLRRNDLIPLQLVLRTIVMDSVIVNSLSIAGPRIPRFTEGIQTATIMVTMLPIMCFFPFLQKYFVKGIMIGAIKA